MYKYIVSFLIAVILIAFGTESKANENVTLMSGFYSIHAGSGNSKTTGKPYNENNYGIGLRIDGGAWNGWMFGTYENSHFRQSIYAAKEWKTGRVGPFQLGLVAGAVTGYNMRVMPLVLPEFIINMWRAEVVFLAQPFDVSNAAAMVAVQLRWKFW